MKPWKVVAFHSELPFYINHAHNLCESLVKLDIPFSMNRIAFKESWQKTAELKSSIILTELNDNTENIVYLDADAVVRQHPGLFDTITEDVAVHYKDGKELLASTIYFKNSDKTKMLVRDWIDIFPQGKTDMREQTYFAAALEKSDCSVYALPPTYALIFDNMKGQGVPVIEQFQASRVGRGLTK